jgi:uncharacterized protein YjbI with pentapeptide repeats
VSNFKSAVDDLTTYERPYRISPVLNSRIAYGLPVLAIAALLVASNALGQDTKDWRWTDPDGNDRTRAHLDEILRAHWQWIRTRHSSGAKAVFSGADLSRANLSGGHVEEVDFTYARLESADLTKAHLGRADLTGAQLSYANLSGAYLVRASLNGANLNHTDLSGARLTYAELNGADFSGANLKDATLVQSTLQYAGLDGAELIGADFADSSFSKTLFTPKSIPNIRGIAAASGLELLTYNQSPDALNELRKQFKDGGFRDQERKITYALKRREADLSGPVNGLFNRVFFDLTCQYGMSPGRPLQLVAALWLLCSVVYLLFFIHISKRSGLHLIPSPEFGRDEKEHATSPQRIRWQHGYSRGLQGLGSKVLQELRLLRTAMFFSLMSAFNIGFRDINFGRWLRLLTKREYDIKAVGWARPVSGLQSLISVYFIALWILTYFGRPFE